MSDVVIRAEGLGKQYRIGGKQESYKTLRESLTRAVSNPFRRGARAAADLGKGPRAKGDPLIWALRDVSFELKRGQVLGVIGGNGAGKSTLLKILSRITEPTAGYAEIRGSIASLLEVGAGFHGELTGRENIFLNGAILGMRKTEIARKFDEIVAFSEVGKFIDTPVRHYSSGMYVRLAFAVAAHLEPEILIVDEILAVGDAAFQKKCLGKMSDDAAKGRTTLFVSHGLPAVQALCSRCILLEAGRIVAEGSPREVIDRYLLSPREKRDSEAVVDLWNNANRLPNMERALKRIWMSDHLGNVTSIVPMGGEVTFHVEYEALETVRQPIIGLRFERPSGEVLCFTNNLVGRGAKVINAPASGTFHCRIPSIPFIAGDYLVTVFYAKWVDNDSDVVQRALKFTVVVADIFGTGRVPESGSCVLDGHWSYGRDPAAIPERVSAVD